MQRPLMSDSWGVGEKIQCPMCKKPIQIISPAEPHRFNMFHFFKHLFSHYKNGEDVYPEAVHYMQQNTRMSVEGIYKQICMAYLAFVWPRMFRFQPCVNYPFVWPEELKHRVETLQNVTMMTNLKLKGTKADEKELDHMMERFKKQYFEDAGSFNFEKKGKVIKFVLSYKENYDDLETRFKIMRKIQDVLRQIRNEKLEFLISIEDRGMRPGSIEIIFLCVIRNEKELGFQDFLKTKMVYLADFEGEIPEILSYNHQEEACGTGMHFQGKSDNGKPTNEKEAVKSIDNRLPTEKTTDVGQCRGG